VDERDLRVGDADRERVIEMLHRAVGEGMITLDEFSTRMDAALAARTRGELSEVVADLPGSHVATDPRQFSLPSATAALPIKVTMSSIHRSGNWRVPERLALKTRFSDVKLDLTQADVRTPVITVDVDDICSSTEIMVPDDFTVDINDLRCLGSSAHSRANTAPPAGRVHVVLRGNVRFGSLTVKHPFGSRLRRLLG
jgi:hypothetical protein